MLRIMAVAALGTALAALGPIAAGTSVSLKQAQQQYLSAVTPLNKSLDTWNNEVQSNTGSLSWTIYKALAAPYVAAIRRFDTTILRDKWPTATITSDIRAVVASDRQMIAILTAPTGTQQAVDAAFQSHATPAAIVRHDLHLPPAPSSSGSGTTGPGQPTGTSVAPTMAGNAQPSVSVTGKTGIEIAYVGAPYGLGSSSQVPFIIWNGSTDTINHVDVSGPAKDANGQVIASGDSQDVEPQNIGPGQLAFGMVYFQQAVPATADFSGLQGSYHKGSSTYFVDAKVTQANYTPSSDGIGPDSVVGAVTNPLTTPIKGPIEADVYCFSASGQFLSVSSGFTSGDSGLDPGGTGSYSTSLYEAQQQGGGCPTFLVGASGFGQP